MADFHLPGSISATVKRMDAIQRSVDAGRATMADHDELRALATHVKNLTRDRDAQAIASADRMADYQERQRRLNIPAGDVVNADADELRSQMRRHIAADRNLSPESQEHYDSVLRGANGAAAAGMARYIAACGSDAYRRAYGNMVVKGGFENLEDPADRAAIRRAQEIMGETRAMSESGSSDAGVPVYVDAIIRETTAETNPLGSIITTVTIFGPTYQGLSAAGTSWAFQSEGSAVAEDAPTFAQVGPLSTYTSRSYVTASLELAADFGGDGLLAELGKSFGRSLADQMASKIIAGGGSTEPTGVQTQMVNTTTNPAHIVATTSGSPTIYGARRAWKALPERARVSPTTAWGMSEDVLNSLRGGTTSTASEVDLVQDPSTGRYCLFGVPVVTSSYFSDVVGTTSAGALAVVGDWSQYVMPVRGPITLEVIPNVPDLSSTGRPLGATGYWASCRYGGSIAVPGLFRVITNT